MTEAKQAAQPERNRINLTKKDYEGAPSTLAAAADTTPSPPASCRRATKPTSIPPKS